MCERQNKIYGVLWSLRIETFLVWKYDLSGAWNDEKFQRKYGEKNNSKLMKLLSQFPFLSV